jgi:hypothetical protein
MIDSAAASRPSVAGVSLQRTAHYSLEGQS